MDIERALKRRAAMLARMGRSILLPEKDRECPNAVYWRTRCSKLENALSILR